MEKERGNEKGASSRHKLCGQYGGLFVRKNLMIALKKTPPGNAEAVEREDLSNARISLGNEDKKAKKKSRQRGQA
ncbi:MAG: hypothetical protein C4293_05620 [Nitrospiraceae bacterium]